MRSEYQHLIDLNDYPVSWWKKVVELGEQIRNDPKSFAHACDGKVMATLFYEPSTRTQMSFQTAMIRLGGEIIGFDNPANSSVAKGETIKDTTKIVSSYADILVIRHPIAGAAKAASLTAECPVVNAGDGGHLHPTQTLTDLLTLKIEKGTLSGLTVGMCGDLINGRTVHSLCKALSQFPGNRFVFISTPELRMPVYIKDKITASGSTFEEVDTLEEAMGRLDVLYMTRIQQERFASKEAYLAQKNTYVLDRKKMLLGKKDLIVMHPLPRVDEITVEVDDDPRAMYFKQAKYGVFVRMALIMTMLSEKKSFETLRGKVYGGVRCDNPRCITNHEEYLPKSFRSSGDETLLECEYCDERKLI
ncbi:MAG: aspartate carbamoyltransferase [Ruminococcus sp.]|nr:aspartate carbamoyltransferase [Ruminococcus sp.]